MPEPGDAQPQAQNRASAAIQAKFMEAVALYQQGKLRDAERIFRKVLQQQPIHFDALHLLGIIACRTGRTERGVELIGKAIRLNAKVADAHYNLGKALQDLKRREEALASYEMAIALDADFVEAHSNRGNVLVDLKRPEEALASYNKAIALNPGFASAIVYCNRGNALQDLKRLEEAVASCNKAIALKSDYAEAYANRGNALQELKRFEEALASFNKAIWLKPDYADAWVGLGNVFEELKRYDEALAAYDKALSLKPDLTGVDGARLNTKMHLCDWKNIDAEGAHLISSIRNGNANTNPFGLLAMPSSPADQLQCAKLWGATKYPPAYKPIWQSERYIHDRIRLAYLSADFHQHVVSSLIVGMFECYDKSHFDVSAISFGGDENSEIRHRLEASVEHFIDVKTYSDEQIAMFVRSLEIDIVVDLMGFTSESRPSIFARRAAPIQANYLGYLGTMGAEYIDYIIADRIVIPTDQYEFYSEKVACLPNCFQVNDRERRIANKIFRRAEVGLPQDGFVFCCFNNSYKITPDVFDIWMRILKQVDGSVLWLVGGRPTIERNLRSEAAARGVNAERLVFAPRISISEHQARLRLADLFLDTLPYNAGATASDTLWVGVPILTHLGDTFVGRMAASALTAIGLPELITTTPEAYERMAIDLATHPEKLAAIRRKLAENRLTTPLFDTNLFTKHIEAAYTAMYERHQAGLAPDHIVVRAGINS